MLEIAVELAAHDPFYQDMAMKFADHFLWIAHAMNQAGPDGMWDEEDGFYYDVLRHHDGGVVRRAQGHHPIGRTAVRSDAATVIEPWQRERVPRATGILMERLQRMPELRESIHPTGPGHLGYAERGIAALVNPDRLRRILTRMLDESEFLSPYGIRALSRFHADHPYVVHVEGQECRDELSSSGVRHRHRIPAGIPAGVGPLPDAGETRFSIRALLTNHFLHLIRWATSRLSVRLARATR